MAAFERVLSGIPEMDKALDNIRLGDNVVWRVSSLDEFHLFVEPYLEQAIKDHRNIIYKLYFYFTVCFIYARQRRFDFASGRSIEQSIQRVPRGAVGFLLDFT
mgnify:CR=1 FL=1